MMKTLTMTTISIGDTDDDHVEDDDVFRDTDDEAEPFEHTEFYLKARKEYYKAMAKANM